MSLSNSTKTLLIDPRSHNNTRTEFRLDDNFYASSIKLVDVGLSDPNATGKSFLYPSLNGVMQLIKNIFIYSDTTLLDSLQNIPQYTALQALKTSNQGSHLNRDLLLNGNGFTINQVDDSADRAGALAQSDAAQVLDLGGTQNNQIPIGANSEQQSGTVMLQQLLSFLETVPVLPKIPNLRLVIEYDTNVANYFNDPGDPITTPNLSVIRPTLVVEQLLNEPDMPDTLQIPFMQTIVERFQVPAAATPANDSVPQRLSFKSQAFNQKFLRDLTFLNSPSGELDPADRNLTRLTRSVAQKGEVLQLVVNNSNHLPDVGIDSPAKKFMYFNDTDRPLNLPLLSALPEIKDASGNIITDDQLVGQYTATAVKVGKRIDDLRVEYQRLYGPAPSSQNAFTLLAYGKVARNMSMQGNRIRLDY
jgi:hypothetical protein